jgi:hypothetical protein
MKMNNEPFLGTAGLNVIVDNCDNVTEVVSTVIDDEFMQVLFCLPARMLTSGKYHMKC